MTIDAKGVAHALGARKSGSGWLARCPAHDDHNPSLSISESNGRILVYCHAGCSQQKVITALRTRALWPEGKSFGQYSRNVDLIPEAEHDKCLIGQVVAEYIYTSESGAPLFRVTRHEPKTFRQWRPDGKGGWLPGLGRGTRIVPYRLHQVSGSRVVFVVEGEKDAETLHERGFVATCNPGGAGKWRQEFAGFFNGKHVIVIPDTDMPGRRHGDQVIRTLEPVAAQVIKVDLRPDCVKDITEWFEAGHSEVELMSIIERAWRVNDEEVEEWPWH